MQCPRPLSSPRNTPPRLLWPFSFSLCVFVADVAKHLLLEEKAPWPWKWWGWGGTVALNPESFRTNLPEPWTYCLLHLYQQRLRSRQILCGNTFRVQQESQTRPRSGQILCGNTFLSNKSYLVTHSWTPKCGTCCNCGCCRQGVWEASSQAAPLRPLELLDPEAEHSRFPPHCRPDGAPNHKALLLHLPEFNRNPQSWGQSTVFLVSRAEAGGKGGGGWKLLCRRKTKTCVPVCGGRMLQ